LRSSCSRDAASLIASEASGLPTVLRRPLQLSLAAKTEAVRAILA